MLRRKLQAKRQLLLGGKGQWGQEGWAAMASAEWGRSTPQADALHSQPFAWQGTTLTPRGFRIGASRRVFS